MPLLLTLVAMGTACAALGAPARRTFPVRLLPSDQVAAGLALTNVSFQAAMLAGPALAGLIIARWGFPAAYAAQAVAVAISVLAVIRLPAMKPEGAGTTGRAADADRERGGWGIVLRRPTLWGSMATDLCATVLAMPVSLFPLVNEIRFDGNPQTLGLFLSAVAVGGITAGLLSGTVTRWRRGGLVQLIAAGVWGVALAGFGLAGPLWLALGCLAVAGAADTVSVITRSTLVQLETPDAYRGRVSSVEHDRRRGPGTRQLPRRPGGVGHLRLLLPGGRRPVRHLGGRRRGGGQRAPARLPHAVCRRGTSRPRGVADAATAAG